MNKFFTSQEILLVINSKFAAKEYINREEEKRPFTHTEKIADACWNGMLGERLPEISITAHSKPLPILEMSEGQRIIWVKLGERDEQPEEAFTINPYIMKYRLN